MADGDIVHIKELGRFTIPGGGNTLTGVAKNNKVMVWGEINATYVSTGIALNGVGGIAGLGLSSLDHIHFQVNTVDSTEVATTVLLSAQLKRTTDKIFISEDDAEGTAPSDADVVVLTYFAVGDSNAAPDQV